MSTAFHQTGRLLFLMNTTDNGKGKSIFVTAMLNLDTGAKDIINVYNDSGTRQSDFVSPQKLEVASNLLTYYYE